MIYTSYFAQLKTIPKNIVPIAICGKSPDWYKGLEYKKLAPKYSFFSEWQKTHDNNYYIKHFNEDVLAKLNIADVLIELQNLGGGKDIVLLCYEKPTDFCHRFLVSDWLKKHNIKCKELFFDE